jgi:hypothetical protein
VSSLPARPSQMNAPSPLVMADACAYFTAMGAAPGTGVSTIAALTSLVGTSPFFMWNCPATGKGVYLDYVKLIVVTPGAGAASIRWAWVTDSLKAAPTGGTTITPVCTKRSAAAPSATALVYTGPLVASAASAQQIVSAGLIRPVAPVVADTYIIKFGGDDFGPAGSQVPTGSAISDRYMVAPPAIVEAGFTGQFHIWLPSQSGASSFEIEAGYAEFA